MALLSQLAMAKRPETLVYMKKQVEAILIQENSLD